MAHDASLPPISVVVATRDRPALLEGCLTALRSTLGEDDEIVVVDSASVAPEVESIATRAGASHHRMARPGASRARNAGWRAARHDLVAFVDDDVRVHASWAPAVREAFADDDGVDFLTGRVAVPEGQEDRDRPVAIFDEAVARTIDADSSGSWGHGANVVVRRPALERVGGFDEAMGPGCRLPAAEDYDLFDRLLAGGSRGRYEPSVVAFHEQWRSRNQLVRLDYRYGKGAGARVSKLLRSSGEVGARGRAGDAARAYLWELGVRQIWRSLRRGYQFGALFAAAKVVGFSVGFVQASWLSVEDGHLRGRGRRGPRAVEGSP